MALAQYQTLANQNLDYPPAPEGAITNESLGYYPQGQAGYVDPQRDLATQSRDLSREAQKLASGHVPEFRGGGIDDPRNRWLGAVLELPPEVAAGILSTHRVNPQEIQQAMQLRSTVGQFQTLSEDTALRRAAAKAAVAKTINEAYGDPVAAATGAGLKLPGLFDPKAAPVTPQGVPGVRAAYEGMPDFQGTAKEVADERNKWLNAQGKLNINLAGGRESTQINRVILAANQAATDLANVAQLPITATRGIFGGRTQGKGLFDAGLETLTNAMTTQEVQTYNTLATGFQRNLAAIEAAGLAPTNALMHQMDAVLMKEGDSNLTKLQKLAQIRQIIEAGMETITSNPRVPKETKDHMNKVVDSVKQSVPFTQKDLLELQRRGAVNPNITLSDVVPGLKETSSNNSWTPEKERRLQELRAKQRGAQ